MNAAVARLIGYTLTVWLVLVWPARFLWGADVPAQSLAACALCLLPAALTLAWANRSAGATPEQQLLAVLGGMLVRMVVVLAGGVTLFLVLPILHAAGFWMWVLGFYLVTLTLEIVLVLTAFRRDVEQRDRQTAPAQPTAPPLRQ